MIFPKLRRRRSPSETERRPGRRGSNLQLPPTPLDGGIISCQVLDTQDRPLSEASVTIVNRLNQRVAQGHTDSYGFYLATVPPGTHKVSISAGGYKRVTAGAEVRTNRHTSLDQLQLEPDPGMAMPRPGIWRFDPDHSSAAFVAQHIGMSKVYGRFANLEGHVQVASPVEQSRVELAIEAASINTTVEARDTHLRSPDFLDVENYPYLYFTSESFQHVRGDRWSVKGHLTIRGHTSPVTLDTTYLGLRSWNGTRTAIRATTELRREDYAVNWQQILSRGIAVVGPTVQVVLDMQAVLEE